MTRVGVIGAGAVGARLARLLVTSAEEIEVVVADERPGVATAVARSLGGTVTAREIRPSRPWIVADRALDDVDVVVLCTSAGSHGSLAAAAVDAGISVVSVSDAIADVRDLLDLDERATAADVAVAAGAGFSPGLTCLLARSMGDRLDHVDEVHVAKAGTGGPACARQHHQALKSPGIDWRDGAWVRRAGGSGRELCWFPDPVAGRDCYRAALADPLVLVPVFPEVTRVTARVWATRRDRLTMHLPMLRRPHPEGLEGAVRVEVRGRLDGAQVVEVRGCAAPPALGAATVAAVTVGLVADRSLGSGAFGLGRVADVGAALSTLQRSGLSLAAFAGSEQLGAKN